MNESKSRVSKLLIVGILVAIAAIAFRLSPAYLKIKVAVELLGWDGFFVVARESVANRVLGLRQTKSRSAFHKFVDSLSDIDQGYCVPQRRVITEDDIAECHRLISHLTSTAFRLYFEVDLLRPHFEPIVGPRMKTLGDNPDALYYSAVFDPKVDFLIRGKLTPGEVYTSFTVYEAECVGCFSQKVVADVNNFQLKVSAEGEYEIVISMRESKPANEQRNWISISSITKGSWPQVITRHYYENLISIQLDNSAAKPILTIEPLDPAIKKEKSPLLNDAISAEKMERVTSFVRSHSLGMIQDPAKAPSWFSFTPNIFGPAVLFRSEVQGVGAVDIVYSAGPFVLKKPDEEGVFIEALMPKAKFVNIVLWNKLLQTFSYEDGRTISLNRKQMTRSNLNPTDLTGSVKVLISKRHPKGGLPKDVEWIDSEGRTEGTMFWRFLLPDGDVQTPTAKLVKLDDL